MARVQLAMDGGEGQDGEESGEEERDERKERAWGKRECERRGGGGEERDGLRQGNHKDG